MADTESLTVAVLKEIRDEVRTTREELSAQVIQTREELSAQIIQTREDLSARIDQTNARLTDVEHVVRDVATQTVFLSKHARSASRRNARSSATLTT